ncbi:uncharacterized protein METZ01_LOCUS219747 [marine metagenome]|uniref:Uncharacterized protein n=1 Tax=marine metagenome TaxID=408172 RepID=A0A382FX93_9ZZZZ
MVAAVDANTIIGMAFGCLIDEKG